MAPVPSVIAALVKRVLGFDWGVNTLITAAIYQHSPAEPEHPLQVSRPLFLNTGGLDGHQARTRRQIDQLKAARDRLAADDPRRARYEEELRRCWRLYAARDRALAHLAANLLLLFASVWGCSIIKTSGLGDSGVHAWGGTNRSLFGAGVGPLPVSLPCERI